MSFDELAEVMFAAPSLIRPAKLFYNDRHDEVVLAPMLYGLTWAMGNEYDRAGSMTRFTAYLGGAGAGDGGGGEGGAGEEADALVTSCGVGIGQQDFSIRERDGSSILFGITSVAEISFPLDMRDPGFDAKARARGIDPDELRRQMGQ